jgi:transcriptional regulator GlxA family with amidase domain
MARASPKQPKSPGVKRRLQVAILILDGSYASPAMGLIDVFHSAGRLWNSFQGEPEDPPFNVQVASVDGKPIDAMGSLGVVPHVGMDDIKEADLILISTVSLAALSMQALDQRVVRWLRARYDEGSAVAGICTGTAYLAEAGLLDDRVATTHWGFVEMMRERYPRVQWNPEHFITEDDRVFCCGGVYASMDLSLFLVEKFAGRETALQCAKSLLLAMPRKHQSPYFAPLFSRPHGDSPVRKAEEFLQAHFHEEISVETLAALAGMGTRTFIRHFKAATGQMPGAYQQALRISAAKGFIEAGTSSIQRICTRVGYQDLAHFRELFKRHTGMTPMEYRGRFAPVDISFRG